MWYSYILFIFIYGNYHFGWNEPLLFSSGSLCSNSFLIYIVLINPQLKTWGASAGLHTLYWCSPFVSEILSCMLSCLWLPGLAALSSHLRTLRFYWNPIPCSWPGHFSLGKKKKLWQFRASASLFPDSQESFSFIF